MYKLTLQRCTAFRAAIAVMAVSLTMELGGLHVMAIGPERAAAALPANPTDHDISYCEVFAGPLSSDPDQPEATGENAALGAALKQYASRKESGDVSAITKFLAAYPNSTWKASLLEYIGMVYFKSGYLEDSMKAWRTSWDAGKTSSAPTVKAAAQVSVAQYARINSRLGRADVLDRLFVELKDEKFSGQTAEYMLAAHEARGLMKNHPDTSFRCGPLAIESILEFMNSPARFSGLIYQCKSTSKGISMDTLKKLSDSLGMNFQLAKRTPGAAVILPAVVNWKAGHYGALLEWEGKHLKIHDPTFTEDISITKKALDTEASGYFLVPAGSLPKGWTQVSMAEAAHVWGKGAAHGNNPQCTTCHDGQQGGSNGGNMGGCPNCNSGGPKITGMPQYSIHAMLVSLHIVDTPLPYRTPVGLPLDFDVSYCQRGILPDPTQSGTSYPNLGAQWSCNWVSYISDDPTQTSEDVSLYSPGGGVDPYVHTSGTIGQIFSPQVSDQSVLTRLSGTSYEIDYADGSEEIYDAATNVNGPGRMVFMTHRYDPAGNSVQLFYNPQNRITAVTGSGGAILRFTYNSDNSIALVSDSNTLFTGPSRTASFTYANGELQSITDAAGMQSSFAYGYGGTVVTGMTTPYGTTAFTCGDNLANTGTIPNFGDPTLGDGSSNSVRWLQATDPEGGTERMEYRETTDTSIVPDSETLVPSAVGLTVSNTFLEYRNTFYWSKKAFMDAPGDYTKAKLTHWLHTTDLNSADGVIESEKAPLESRIWYNYSGQPSPIVIGTSNSPSAIARVVNASGATQLYQYQYNSFGNLIKNVDPTGRTATYTYAANGIDVASVYQENPSATGTDSFGQKADKIAALTYDSNHDLISMTDASGQITTGTYNGRGQIVSRSVKVSGSSQNTTFAYDSNAFLQKITGPVPFTSATTTFTYDNRDRVQTVTNSEGYTLTYAYDPLNRLTSVTYPDSTTDQTIYNRLDAEWKKDRMNRWTHLLHDNMGRLTFVVDPAGHTTQYQYCPCGALTGIIDGNSNTTSFILDIQSRVTEKVYPDNATIQYSYEQPYTSRLQTVTNARSQTTSYAYNLDNTASSVTYSGTVTPSVAFGYDSVYPRLTSMADSVSGTTIYNYNPSSVTGTLGGGRVGSIVNTGSSAYTLSYKYDELGRVVSRAIDGTTNTETIAYDALGRVTQMANATGTFNYNPLRATDMVDHIDYPNGQRMQNAYYPTSVDERLQTISNLVSASGTSLISQFGYSYDAAGDVTGQSQQLQPGTAAYNYQYGYDGALELLSAIRSGTGTDTYAYNYDTAGNRTGQQIDFNVSTASYNDNNQLTSQTGGGTLLISGSLAESGTAQPGTVSVNSVTVITDSNGNFRTTAPVVAGSNNIPISATDSNGNVTNKSLIVNVPSGTATGSLSYDADGNMTSDGTNSNTYTWDAANRLLSITYNTGASTRFSYDGMGRRMQILEVASGGTVTGTNNFIWDGLQLREERNGGNTVTKLYFDRSAQISGTNLYYTKDYLANIRELVTGTSGTVQARYDYDPYGNQTLLSGTSIGDFGYTSLYYHAASGLYLAVYREYSSRFTRLISRDPIGEQAGPNLYRYVLNDPVYWIDPLGLNPGDPYSTRDAAANDALNDAYNATMSNPDTEYGGNIYQMPNGKYSYTPLQSGMKNAGDIGIKNDVQCPNKKAGDFHSHPMGGLSQPSQWDVNAANPALNSNAVPGYNVGPDKRKWWSYGGQYGPFKP
jgi:RHS repeat-associated protein